MSDPINPAGSPSGQSLEMAHVLFMDLLGYSLLPTDVQKRVLKQLQDTVRESQEFKRAQSLGDLICLPTGDGMALVFFRAPEAPVRCAIELSKALRETPDIRLRMGIHAGPVYRVADINANRNVTGGGINVAQRVMDCGDAGHVLLSKSAAEMLGQVAEWRKSLQDLGEVEVKHGLRLHLFNFVAEQAGNRATPSKLRAVRTKRMQSALGALAALAVLAIAVNTWLAHARRAKALNQADTVLLADFDNKTGDAVFDETLKQALSVSLRQSPFLNLVPEEKVTKTLRMMMRPADTRLTPEVAREVCQRAASKAYIAGSIANLGAHYVVGLDAVNCQTGDLLGQQQAEAEAKEKVLDAMGRAAEKLREELGESLSTVEKFATPLVDATTPSLDALRAFSLAKLKARHDDTAAIPFFKRAIELDPKFASAYESLGVSYYNLGEAGLAAENFTKAFQLKDRASERERLPIAVRYYEYVTGQLDKAIEEYQLWAQTYPRDARAHANLGGLYAATGRIDQALAETMEAVRLSPEGGANYTNLILSYTDLNRLDEARKTYDEAMARGLDTALTRVSFFGVAFLEHDTAEIDRQMEWAAGKAGTEDIFFNAKADVEAYYGRLGAAREYWSRAVASALRSGQKETAAQWALDRAIWEAELGDVDGARREVASALRISSNHESRILAALAMARAGELAQAAKMAKDLEARYPVDTLVTSYWLPVIRASMELHRKDAASALKTLETASSYELASPDTWPGMGTPLYPIYLRGECRLMTRESREAEKEFQRLLDRRGLLKTSPVGLRARLGLGRAYALEGDTPRARGAYEEFFQLWKDADRGLPIATEAKIEQAKLK